MTTMTALSQAIAAEMPEGVHWTAYESPEKRGQSEVVIETVGITLSEVQKARIRVAADNARPVGFLLNLRFIDNVQMIEGEKQPIQLPRS